MGKEEVLFRIFVMDEMRSRYRDASNRKIASDEELGVNPTSGVHLHLLHFIRVELLLDALRERGRQAAPCRGLAASIVHRRRERVVDGQVRRKREALRRRGRGALRERGRSGRERRGEGGGGRVGVAEEALLGYVRDGAACIGGVLRRIER